MNLHCTTGVCLSGFRGELTHSRTDRTSRRVGMYGLGHTQEGYENSDHIFHFALFGHNEHRNQLGQKLDDKLHLGYDIGLEMRGNADGI